MRASAAIVVFALLVGACASNADTSTSTTAPTQSSTTVANHQATTVTTTDPVGLQAIADDAVGALIYVSDASGARTAVSGEGTNGLPIEAGDAFFIGSASKMITAIAVLQLVDEGLIGLDDLLADHVEFEVATPITIRHLLQHKSGLGDSDAIYDSCDPADVLDGMAALLVNPYNFEPGAHAIYSTNGFNMLSFVLSSATGMPTADVFRRNLFEPLGMTSTFLTGAEEGPALAFGENSWDSDCASERMDIGIGGGFASSAADLDTLMRALFEGNLLSPESLKEMTTPDSQVNGFDYGLGIGVLYPPDGTEQPMYGHWGSMGWEAGAVYDPKEQRTIAALIEIGDFDNTVWKVAEQANNG